MQFKRTLSAILSLILLFVVFPAHSVTLGVAADYNVFVFGDFTSNGGHTEGNMAAGGNFNAPNGYSAATSIQGSADPRIVADGNVNIGGSGSVGANGSGTIYASSASLSPNFTANGGVVSPQNLIDFTSAETYYKSLSTSLSGMTANGDTVAVDWGGKYGIYLNMSSGSAGESLYVFEIDASQIGGAISTIELDANISNDATILINVKGSAEFLDGEVKLNGIDAENVLFNFDEDSTDIDITGYGMYGSFLAAWADVTANNGQFNGQMIAGSLDGSMEFHNTMFDGNIPVDPVPLPAAFWLFGSAFGFLSLLSRRRKQTN